MSLIIEQPGLIVPPLTPFDAGLKVDFAKLKTGIDVIIERTNPTLLIAAGVEAQEYQYLSYPERLDLIRATIDFAGRRPVGVGITHPSFKVAIELAHFAEKHGASAVQLLAPQKPTGGHATTRELVRYFEAVGRETSLPIVLYLNAGPGADLSVKDTVELAKLDCVHFIKESSRDLSRVSRLIVEIQHAGLAQYFTTMQMLLITLQLGGAGVTLPFPAAEITRHIVDAFKRGDLKTAAKLQAALALFPGRWMPFGLAAVMKAASNHLGVPAGEPYPPYEPVQGPALEELRHFLDTQFPNLKRAPDA